MRVPSALLAAFIAAGCAAPKIEKRPEAPAPLSIISATPKKAQLFRLRGTPKEQELALARLTAAHGLLTGQIKLTPAGTLKFPYQQVDLTDLRYASALHALIREVDQNEDGLDVQEASRAITAAKNRLSTMKTDAELLARDLEAQGAIPVFTTKVGNRTNVNGLTVLTTPEQSQNVARTLIGFLSSQGLINTSNASSEYQLKREANASLRARLSGLNLRIEFRKKVEQTKSKAEIPELAKDQVGITVTFPPEIYSEETFHPIHLGLQYARERSSRLNPRTMYGNSRQR